LRPFSLQSLETTKVEWLAQLKRHQGEIVRSPYEQAFAWATDRIDYAKNDNEQFYYGLFNRKTQRCDAIADLTYTKRARKWLKMVDLMLSPDLDITFYDKTADRQRFADLFTAAVLGVVKLTGSAHPSRTVKIYGRSPTLLKFLKGLEVSIKRQGNPDGTEVSIEGRWFVIRATS
jgi:hypothetical protein